VVKYVTPDITSRDDETENDNESESISVSSVESSVRQDDQPKTADYAKPNINALGNPMKEDCLSIWVILF